jgi:small subunit ribosomal protein S6
MSAPAPTYDLVMLLDPDAEDGTRAKLVGEARKAIEKQGQLMRHDEWGNRQLAYAIERKSVAEYHLMQFHVDSPELLGTLNRSLRIADEILRFRIIKLRPGVPEPPDMRSSAPSPRRAEAEPTGDGAPEQRGDQPAPEQRPGEQSEQRPGEQSEQRQGEQPEQRAEPAAAVQGTAPEDEPRGGEAS